MREHRLRISGRREAQIKEPKVLREALRFYGRERRWQRLRRYGVARGQKVGLTQADVAPPIKAFRRGR